MLRTPATNLLRKSLVRSSPALAIRAASTHAISNPTLANIEKRWEGMPLQEQADLWMALRDRMGADWKELTLQEKKAGASNLYLSISRAWRKYLPDSRAVSTNCSTKPSTTPPPHISALHKDMEKHQLHHVVSLGLQLSGGIGCNDAQWLSPAFSPASLYTFASSSEN